VALWIAFALMGLAAALFVAVPLYRRQHRLSPLIVVSVACVVALSVGLYARQGSPDLPSVAGGAGAESLPGVDDMVVALAERLERQPNDLEGWKMLGRSYMSLRNFSGAVLAFERANELEASQNAQTLVELGEALLARDATGIGGRIANLFESALALEPANPTALFYGGIGAANNGNTGLAADRWETLLTLDPPPEIRQVLTMRIAEWRGEEPPAEATLSAAPAPAADPGATRDYIVSASISLSAPAAQALPADAVVFVIARDPAQPSPPIAVIRRRLAELPMTVALDDSNSMVQGRSLSGFEQFELIARVSLSGQPSQQSGDWFGSRLVRPAEAARVELAIDQQVP
jgi:cytochrome c-type biogenesis protein CcmH